MDFSDGLKKLRRVADGSGLSPRKLAVLGLLLLLVLLYTAPALSRAWAAPRAPAGSALAEQADSSLSSRLLPYRDAVEEHDASVVYRGGFRPAEGVPAQGEHSDLPFVGNGYIGLWPATTPAHLYLHHHRTLSIPLEYEPLAIVSIPGSTMQEGIITQYKTGCVHRIQAYSIASLAANHAEGTAAGAEMGREGSTQGLEGMGAVVEVNQRVYAHRTVPGVVVQDITIVNPFSMSVFVRISRPASKWGTSTPITVSEHPATATTGHTALPLLGLAVSIVAEDAAEHVVVAARKSHTLQLRTAVNYTSDAAVDLTAVTQQLRTQLSALSTLLPLHTTAWKTLHSQGVSVESSKAVKAVNGDRVNATLYSILSMVRSPLLEAANPARRAELTAASTTMAASDGCYSGHLTLQALALWRPSSTPEEAVSKVDTWLVTLQKQGCNTLVSFGASGTLSALLLSIGGFSFRHRHLQYNTQAGDLHRHLHFRHLPYGPCGQVNVTVQVGEEDLLPRLWVTHANGSGSASLEQCEGGGMYACDGGCLDPPVQLGSVPRLFPVKQTVPMTAVLYITPDLAHVSELKKTIHVRELKIAPPHHHTLISLHRHGHKWGALSPVFWLTVGSLILIFHVFLIKLVITEYCGTGEIIAPRRYRKFSDL